jgi:hypothetical protein
MWLESNAFIIKTPGQAVLIRNGNGIIYQRSENAVTTDRLAALVAVGPSGEKAELGTPVANENWLDIPFTPKKAGNYWVGLASKPRKIRLSGEDFTGYLEHDGIPAIIQERKEKGISDRDEIEQYSKYVKLYLQVGDTGSDNFNEPIGLRIEIIPLKNPYGVKAGGNLPVQVLFKGKPLAGLTLHAGFSGQGEEALAVETDKNGKAQIGIGKPGKWYIRGIHLAQVDLDDHSYESHWATLTFEVAGG